MRKYLLTLSTLFIASNVCASEINSQDLTQTYLRHGGAANDLIEDINLKISEAEQKRELFFCEDFINTVIAPDNLCRTYFNSLATEPCIKLEDLKYQDISIGFIVYQLPLGVSKETFINEQKPSDNAYFSNNLKGLKRERVEKQDNCFKIKYSYEASFMDKKGGTYDISVKVPFPTEFNRNQLTINDLTRRKQHIEQNINLNLTIPTFPEEHQDISSYFQLNQNQFNLSCDMLAQLFAKRESSPYANKVYINFATNLFQFRDLIAENAQKLFDLRADQNMKAEFDLYIKNVNNFFATNIVSFYSMGFNNIITNKQDETIFASY